MISNHAKRKSNTGGEAEDLDGCVDCGGAGGGIAAAGGDAVYL